MFFKSLHIAPSGILVNGSILEELLTNDLAGSKAGRGDKFDIHLYSLAGTIHLLVRFRDVLGIRGMKSHDTLFFEETVETGNGAGIAALHELDPENDETGIRVTPAHIVDELNLLGSMLVRMVMWSSGVFTQRFDRAVEAAFPAVDILAVGFVFDGRLCDSLFFIIFNKG